MLKFVLKTFKRKNNEEKVLHYVKKINEIIKSEPTRTVILQNIINSTKIIEENVCLGFKPKMTEDQISKLFVSKYQDNETFRNSFNNSSNTNDIEEMKPLFELDKKIKNSEKFEDFLKTKKGVVDLFVHTTNEIIEFKAIRDNSINIKFEKSDLQNLFNKIFSGEFEKYLKQTNGNSVDYLATNSDFTITFSVDKNVLTNRANISHLVVIDNKQKVYKIDLFNNNANVFFILYEKLKKEAVEIDPCEMEVLVDKILKDAREEK